MVDDLLASRGDAQPGRSGSRDFDLLAWRDAWPVHFFDEAAGQGGAAAGFAMGYLGRDGRSGSSHRSSATLVDPGGRRIGWRIHRTAVSAFAFVPLGILTLGWPFAVSGMGAALFPWITGLVSARFHSLRYGLMVPCITGVAMAVLNWLIFRGRQTTNATHTALL